VIVVDTNIVSYLCLRTEFTPHAEQAFKIDSDWAAPLLWRSEFRNLLAGFIRKQRFTKDSALRLIREAEGLLERREFAIPSELVMELVSRSTCSAYDCEFVALAQDLRVPLVTMDQQILREFPKTAVKLAEFVK
jgi:predicted nucleic acid-binding protein